MPGPWSITCRPVRGAADHHHRGVGRHVDGVVHQVLQQDEQRAAIGQDLPRRGAVVDAGRDLSGVGLARQPGLHVVDHVADRDLREAEVPGLAYFVIIARQPEAARPNASRFQGVETGRSLTKRRRTSCPVGTAKTGGNRSRARATERRTRTRTKNGQKKRPEIVPAVVVAALDRPTPARRCLTDRKTPSPDRPACGCRSDRRRGRSSAPRAAPSRSRAAPPARCPAPRRPRSPRPRPRSRAA